MIKSKVTLHLHLDGAIRPETSYFFAKQRGVKLPVDTLEGWKEFLKSKQGHGADLQSFLQIFDFFLPTIAGCEEAISQIAYELCEDAAKDGILYLEVRYNPHLLSSISDNEHAKPHTNLKQTDDYLNIENSVSALSPRDVVLAVNKALARGERDFGITVNSILCCLRERPEWSCEVLDLCVEFRNQNVVGIDIAGSEKLPLSSQHLTAFKKAHQQNINITVHAGENGTAENVLEAIETLHAKRIGHGYHVIDNPAIFKQALQAGVHFEVCPYSSLMTGSVPTEYSNHPVKKFCEANASYSISTDDPGVTGFTLSEEYEFLKHEVGLTASDLKQSNINAALASFLPKDQKEKLISTLKELHEHNDCLY